MKGKNLARFIVLTLVILYAALYIAQATGYYEYTSRKTNTLTEEAVKKFEKDIQQGKKVDATDYVKEENDYSNTISKGGYLLSNAIGKTFDSLMKYIFKEVNKAVG